MGRVPPFLGTLRSTLLSPILLASGSVPSGRMVRRGKERNRRRGEGSTNEERDDRDETRNTGDNQGSVCKVGTQDPENLDEELKPLVTVWSRLYPSSVGSASGRSLRDGNRRRETDMEGKSGE